MIWFFLKLRLVWSIMPVDDAPRNFRKLIFIFAFLFNPSSWKLIFIEKETPNILTRIFFLLIDYNFTPVDSILFGELFALFFSAFFTFSWYHWNCLFHGFVLCSVGFSVIVVLTSYRIFLFSVISLIYQFKYDVTFWF